MLFQKGQSGNPAGRLRYKLIGEILKDELGKPLGTKRETLTRMRSASGYHEIVRQLLLRAYSGEMAAIKEVIDRVDGRVPLAVDGSMHDEPTTVNKETSLKELARCVGYLLLSQQPDPEPEVLEN